MGDDHFLPVRAGVIELRKSAGSEGTQLTLTHTHTHTGHIFEHLNPLSRFKK